MCNGQFESNFAEIKSTCNKINKIWLCHCCTNMNSVVMQQSKTHTCSFNKEVTPLWCLGWLVLNEKQGKQESLNHYRIIMNVPHQKVLQEQQPNIHKVGFVEKQSNTAMNYSALSNVEQEQL